MEFERTKMIKALRQVVQRMHHPLNVKWVCVRGCAAYLLSFRRIGEMMTERGVFLGQAAQPTCLALGDRGASLALLRRGLRLE